MCSNPLALVPMINSASQSRHASRRSSCVAGLIPEPGPFPLNISPALTQAIDNAERPSSHYGIIVGIDAAEAGMNVKLYGNAAGHMTLEPDLTKSAILGRREKSTATLAPPLSYTGSKLLVPVFCNHSVHEGEIPGLQYEKPARIFSELGKDPVSLPIKSSSSLLPPVRAGLLPEGVPAERPIPPPNVNPSLLQLPVLSPPLAGNNISARTTDGSAAKSGIPEFVFVVTEGDNVKEQGKVAAMPTISIDRLREKEEKLASEVVNAHKILDNLNHDIDGLKAAIQVCEQDELQLDSVIRQLVSENLQLLQLPGPTSQHGERLQSIAERHNKELGSVVMKALATAAAAHEHSRRPTNANFYGSTTSNNNPFVSKLGFVRRPELRNVASRLGINEALHRAANKAVSRMGSVAGAMNML
ncbi:hypothetical protein DFJ77DRAFT_468357 [Powellomyces hirtus]|nr:hypothetical protein DFJ77DRAFT_468357 [Powellomyces hirtus]